MAENADQRCSTFLLPQCGQEIFSFSCRTMVKILEKTFLQAGQKKVVGHGDLHTDEA